jgi:ribosome biogenesis GTPase A
MAKSDALQWYPGHMAKAGRQIQEKLKLIDTVIEVLDARVPIASRNPEILKFVGCKGHIILLNKSDLADPGETSAWQQHLAEEQGVLEVMAFNAFDKRDKKRLISSIQSYNPKKKETLKCLICGIPNVGKSTIINTLIGRKKTQIGDKPGVTKGQQWLTTPSGFMLLDTPGILWPRFEDESIGMHLAWIGSIKDTLFEPENIAAELLRFLCSRYPDKIREVYDVDPSATVPEVFDGLARKRGLLLKGGEFDYFRTSQMLLGDFRSGRLGRITIDGCQ